MKRFYLPETGAVGKQRTISGSDARHMHSVLRFKPGTGIVVFDGTGFDYDAEIVSISPDSVTVSILQRYPSRPESRAKISVGQALLKGKKMDTLIRQMTELGVAQWVPFMAERSIPTPDQKRRSDRLERWRAIVRESLKQSGRGEFTQVSPIVSYREMLSMEDAHAVKLIFWENAVEPLETVIQAYPADSRTIHVVLGPEGGFTDREIDTALSLGFKAVSLGSRILRAETAALTVCALMQHLFGDLGRM